MDNQLIIPGFESKSNGNNGKSANAEFAELAVPRELEIELETRKFNGFRNQTEWHNSVFYGDNKEILSKMQDETVDLILTDPPYNINYKSNRRVKNAKYKHLKNDNSNDWIPDFAREAFRVLKNNRHLYCFCRHDTYPDFVAALQEAGFKLKRTLIWVKNNHGSGDLKGDYAPQDEWIIYCHKGRRPLNGKRESNILYYSKLSTKEQTHSTEKPVKLLKYLIGKSTKRGELVLDPFSGSGSTMHAAIEKERAYCVMELSEEYFYTTEMRRMNQKQSDMLEGMYDHV